MRKLPYYFALLIFLISCEEKTSITPEETALGVLELEFDISDAASADFEKGLLLIHSFEYDDARTAFQEAKRLDSTEVMAYWGEAMSHYKALWGLQDKRAGYEVLEQRGMREEDRLSSIADPLKRDFWIGVEILYGDGSLKARNERFNLHMKDLTKKYPSNQEASAFYALSMMWDNDNDEESTVVGKRSADIAKGILAENPLHPGALHYTIHAYDNPLTAAGAMDAANKYASVAPDATHALHMPSHIFLALGMWPEVVSSNEASYKASVARMKKLELDDDARGYHSYAWLHYAYLQQGRVEEATELLAEMSDFYKNTQSKGIRSYIASMQASQLFETGEWPEKLRIIDIDKSDLGLGAQMREAIFDVQLVLMEKSDEKIADIISNFKNEIKKGELYISEDKASMCSAGPSRYAPNKDAVMKAKVVLNQMKAMEQMAIGNDKGVGEYLRIAANLESESEYSSGPTDVPLPSFEMYGYWLMENGQLEKAQAQFEKSLERAPKRRNALKGMMALYEKQGKKKEMKEVETIINGFNINKSITSI